jgi:hypothetical protein
MVRVKLSAYEAQDRKASDQAAMLTLSALSQRPVQCIQRQVLATPIELQRPRPCWRCHLQIGRDGWEDICDSDCSDYCRLMN